MKTKYIPLIAFGLFVTAAFAEDSSGPSVKISGSAEFDAYAATTPGADDSKLYHSYSSTIDLDIDVQFNEKWSAYVGLEADGTDLSTSPGAYYNGAFVQYLHSEALTVKFGDLTFSEGAFLNYYGYDDPGDDAAGMAEHDIRGFEVDYLGLQLGLGFARGGNDNVVCGVDEDGNIDESNCAGTAYDVHAAYALGFGEQVVRPYADYKSYQEAKHNELHAGVDASLKFGSIGLHAVYGLHTNYLGEDEGSMSHAILVEPSFEAGKLAVKATAFYAIIDDDALKEKSVMEFDMSTNPEYMFFYIEPSMGILEALTLGIPLEYHTNSLDSDDKLETFDAGIRAYFSPVSGLDVTGFVMADIKLGDDYKDNDDMSLSFGVETAFSF